MKLHFLASTLLVATGLASPLPDGGQKHWVRVSLPAPENWIAGPSLFPGRVLKGDHSQNYKQYNSKTWAAHALKYCQGSHEATTALSYSAINSGTPKKRFWFAYCFIGNATTSSDFVRDKGVQGSVAYTIRD